MARASLVRAEVDGLQLHRIQANLVGSTLFGGALRSTLKETVQEGEARVQSRAPLGRTLQLWGSIDSTLDPHPVPMWAKITAGATNRGFRYGWALEASKRIVYRHRGRPTRRWFRGARSWIKKRLQQRVARMKGQIEGRWRR